MEPTLAALLTCPDCGGDFAPGPAAACCMECGRERAVDAGIVSLISDGARTALDDLDYDAVYRIDADASHAYAKSCLDLLGDRIPPRVDTFLEVGAGTGLFTLGFLKQVAVGTAVVTDISPSMLEVCRRRLVEHDVDKDVALHFVTWDGQPCFRADAFQLIAGFSVLHHVLDFEGMLATLSGALRNDGIAVFLEPNYRFHVALVDTVCGIFASIMEDEAHWTADDRNALAAWLFENNTNLRFRGDDYVLAGREDKHLFDGGQLRDAAHRAGFERVELIPFGDRSECYVALKVYSNQIGLADAARDDLLERFSRLLPGNFAHLAEEDLAPSSLIVLHRGTAVRGASAASASGPGLHGEARPRFRYDLSLAVAENAGEWTLQVQGWVLGDADVAYLVVDTGTRRLRFPVQWIRPDVNQAFNARNTYPVRRALFSGLRGTPVLTMDSMSVGIDAALSVVTVDGREFALGHVALPASPGQYPAARIDG